MDGYGPYNSSDEHLTGKNWNEPGIYNVKVRCSDNGWGTFSEWSDSISINVVDVDVKIKNRLVFVTAEIKNKGNIKIENLYWNISVTGDNIRRPENKYTSGFINSILPRSAKRIPFLISGSGFVEIILSVYPEGYTFWEGSKVFARGVVFGSFVIVL